MGPRNAPGMVLRGGLYTRLTMTVAREGVVERHRREGVQGCTREVHGCRLEVQESTVEEGSTPTDNLRPAVKIGLGLVGSMGR